MRIIIAYEWKYEKKHWLHSALEQNGYEVIAVGMRNVDRRLKLKKWHKIIELIDYLMLAIKSYKIAKPGDIFIGWCFTVSVFYSIFDKKKCKRIIANNILIQDKKNIPNRIRNKMYKKAFKNEKFIATSNSKKNTEIALNAIGYEYEKKFKIIHDVFFPKDNQVKKRERYCFCGGTSSRDWETLLNAAKKCPEIQFHIIAGSGNWNKKLEIPNNVYIEFDVTEENFTDTLNKSNFIVLPVSNEVTSGLLVLFEGINARKIVLSSYTEAIAHYYPPHLRDKYLFPIGDSESLKSKIKEIYDKNLEGEIEEIYEYNAKYNSLDQFLKEFKNLLY